MISKKQQDTFKSMHHKLIKDYNGSFAMAMKKYLIEELSKKMTE